MAVKGAGAEYLTNTLFFLRRFNQKALRVDWTVCKKIIRFPFEGNGLFDDKLKYFLRVFSAGYLPPCCKIQIRYYIFFYAFVPRICHCFQLRRYAFQTLPCQGF